MRTHQPYCLSASYKGQQISQSLKQKAKATINFQNANYNGNFESLDEFSSYILQLLAWLQRKKRQFWDLFYLLFEELDHTQWRHSGVTP